MDHEDFRACLISMGYDLVRQKLKFYYYDILLSLFRFVFYKTSALNCGSQLGIVSFTKVTR